jgi:hypothetical protein
MPGRRHVVLSYDGSFAGFLSAVFEVFRRKFDASIAPFEDSDESLFGPHVQRRNRRRSRHAHRPAHPRTDGFRDLVDHRAGVPLGGTGSRARPPRLHPKDHRSREAGAHNVLFESVLDAKKMAKRTDREVHRMHAFVRFEETEAASSPRASRRTATSSGSSHRTFSGAIRRCRWAIFDERRHYGVFYDGRTSLWIDDGGATADRSSAEERFQHLWKTYYRSVNIPSDATIVCTSSTSRAATGVI